MAVQKIRLYLEPKGVADVAHVSQMDVKRQIQFLIYDENGAYSFPNGSSVSINGQKPDGHLFDYSENDYVSGTRIISKSGNIVTVYTTPQMTAVEGNVACQIRIVDSNGGDIGILPFTMNVQRTPLASEQGYSQSDLPSIVRKYNEFNEDAEAWARGTRKGTPVGSGDETYHNNSKYYSEQATSSAATASTKASEASASATNSANKALVSEGYANGMQNGSAVGSGSPYYHNNSKYYSEQSKASADRAQSYAVNTPYIGANGNWWVWNGTQNRYVDTGVDASITVQIADITMLAPNASPYVTNSGTNTDPIFHLFIPKGTGITSIRKTGTSGLIDTYTITYSDGSTTTFTVANGNGVSSISKTSSSGLDDIYTIRYTNGSTSTFTVTNGKTAYQSAVEGGYPGTEAEFEADLANFEDWKIEAEMAAEEAEDSASSAAQSAAEAANSASLAEQYADFVTPHFIIENNRLYIKDDAVGEFIVANNRLYIKLAS